MPEYDYQCEKCSAEFVKEHPMAFNGKVKCPSCGSSRTVKVFHATGVVFKGSGFYVTDSSNSRSAASGVSTNGHNSTDTDTADTADSKDKADAKSKAQATDKADKQAVPAPSTNGQEPAKDSPKTSGQDKK